MTHKQRLLLAFCLLFGLGFPFAFSSDPGVPLTMGIKGADRIVIRNGGHDSCRNDVDTQEVLAEITDSQGIEEISQNLTFQRRYQSILPTVAQCSCCGYPGIDWYRDGRRIALTSIQHGAAVQCAGFDHDARLSTHSSRWLAPFLDLHDVPKTQPTTDAAATGASARQN